MKALLVLAGIVLLFVLMGMVWAKTASQPELGIHDGKLLPLPKKPNGVATQSGKTEQHMEPIPYSGDREAARQELLQILNQLPHTTLIKEDSEYIWIEFRSPFFGFPDDVEFSFEDSLIHFRAAARLGHSDMGVNYKRMENIKTLFQQ